MAKQRWSYVVPVLACLSILTLAGCGERSRTPTEPLTSASSADRTAAATASSQPGAQRPPAGLPEAVAEPSRGGHGGSHGAPGGQGGGHRGGNGGGTPAEVHLSLEIQPDTWNTNYVRSRGTVTARINGSGLDTIDLGSIVLAGSAGSAAPRRVQRVGNHVQAFFGKADAFATLASPKPGDTVKVTIRLTAGGAAQELTDTIRIVGPAA